MAARSPPTAAGCCCASSSSAAVSCGSSPGCCRDHRQPGQVEHSVRELVSQRVYGLVLEATLLFIQQAVEQQDGRLEFVGGNFQAGGIGDGGNGLHTASSEPLSPPGGGF